MFPSFTGHEGKAAEGPELRLQGAWSRTEILAEAWRARQLCLHRLRSSGGDAKASLLASAPPLGWIHFQKSKVGRGEAFVDASPPGLAAAPPAPGGPCREAQRLHLHQGSSRVNRTSGNHLLRQPGRHRESIQAEESCLQKSFRNLPSSLPISKLVPFWHQLAVHSPLQQSSRRDAPPVGGCKLRA